MGDIYENLDSPPLKEKTVREADAPAPVSVLIQGPVKDGAPVSVHVQPKDQVTVPIQPPVPAPIPVQQSVMAPTQQHTNIPTPSQFAAPQPGVSQMKTIKKPLNAPLPGKKVIAQPPSLDQLPSRQVSSWKDMFIKRLPLILYLGFLLLVAFISFILGYLYLPYLEEHSLLCGFYVLEKHNDGLKSVQTQEKKDTILKNYGLMALAYGEGSHKGSHINKVEQIFKEYRRDVDNKYQKICRKHEAKYGKILTVLKDPVFDADEWQPNELTIFSWMAPQSSLLHFMVTFLDICSLVFVGILIFVILLRLRYSQNVRKTVNQVFVTLASFCLVLQVLSIATMLIHFISYDGPSNGIVLAYFALSTIGGILVTLIISLLVYTQS
uniref:TRP domain-containing protein n=1 Tax=Parastrongyloides trichosuri TaxID=131310 RepID=A0A0N5A2X7_PARTI